MLLYQQAFDFHHSLFRILLILESIGKKPIEPEKLRILDFYLLFPQEITTIETTQLQLQMKRKFASYPQYETISNPAKVFYRLEPIFEHGLKSLVAAGIVERVTDKKSDTVRLTNKPLPKTLLAAIHARQAVSTELLDFLVGQLFTFPLHGPAGLKARTKLLPSKHDRH